MYDLISQISEAFKLVPTVVYWGIVFATIVPLFLFPFYIARLPYDHWVRYEERAPGYFYIFLSNILALFFCITGFVLLFLPGQGLLMILLGLSISFFPGKKKLIIYLVRKRRLQRALNKIRGALKRSPFIWPSD